VRAIERPGGAVLFRHRFDRTADRPFRPADDRAPVIRRYYPHAPSPAGPRPRPWGLSTAFITTRLGYGVCVAFTTGVWVGAVRKPVEGGAHPAKRPRGPTAGPASSRRLTRPLARRWARPKAISRFLPRVRPTRAGASSLGHDPDFPARLCPAMGPGHYGEVSRGLANFLEPRQGELRRTPS
jgi:hypothetical protein